MRRRITLWIVAVALLAASMFAARRPHAGRAAHDLRRGLAHGRLPIVRRRAALQLRRLEHPRDADPERRPGRHLRVGRAAQHAATLLGRARREARHLHLEPARADRAAVEPGGDPLGLRPEAEAGQARDLRPGRARRRVHADGAAQDGAHLGALEGRQPGVRRARGDGQGRARPGRRRLRLRHGRAGRVAIRSRRSGFRRGRSRASATRSPWCRGRRRKAAAQAWIRTLLSARGQAALRSYGFLPLPKRVVARRRSSERRSSSRRASPSSSCCCPSSRCSCRCRPGRARLGARERSRRGTRSGSRPRRSRSRWPCILGFGTPAAYWISTRRGALRDVLVTLVELPLVLPPAVAGIGLLVAFGRLGLLGGTIDALGIDIAFTKVAVILAVTFVASPFYLRTADRGLRGASTRRSRPRRGRSARGRGRVFLRVMLPLARGGLGAGAALAFARGLGEFGATIMFAGSLQGVTQTLSLAIYEQFDVDFDVALAISALLIVDQRARPPLRQARDQMALRAPVHSPSSHLRRVGRPDRRAGRDARARRTFGRREDDRCCASSPACSGRSTAS